MVAAMVGPDETNEKAPLLTAPMIGSDDTTENGGGIKIIHAGLFRTATMSMAAAYRILGFKAHHGVTDSIYENPWSLIEDAAYATWPLVLGTLPPSSRLPLPRPRPYTREDWDRLWGQFDVATDLSSPFAEAMIEVYPDAKVVVVQRNFEAWWDSFKRVLLDKMFHYHQYGPVARYVCWNVLRMRPGHAMQAVLRGWLGTMDAREMTKERARAAYDGYYGRIRATVPAERRLEYEIGSGWGPLCEFLGKEVPRHEDGTEVEFPRLNDAATHAEVLDRYWMQMVMDLARVVVRLAAMAAVGMVLVLVLVLVLVMWWCRFFESEG